MAQVTVRYAGFVDNERTRITALECRETRTSTAPRREDAAAQHLHRSTRKTGKEEEKERQTKKNNEIDHSKTGAEDETERAARMGGLHFNR